MLYARSPSDDSKHSSRSGRRQTVLVTRAMLHRPQAIYDECALPPVQPVPDVLLFSIFDRTLLLRPPPAAYARAQHPNIKDIIYAGSREVAYFMSELFRLITGPLCLFRILAPNFSSATGPDYPLDGQGSRGPGSGLNYVGYRHV